MKILSLLLLTVLLFSCKKELDPNADYIIFATHSMTCAGEESMQVFKLSGNKLYKKEGPGDFLYGYFNGEFQSLNNSKYKKAKKIDNLFPSTLLDEIDWIIGNPRDCLGSGGYRIEYKKGARHEWYYIDDDLTQVPEYLHLFLNELNTVIQDLE